MSDVWRLKKLQEELQPEADRMRDHDRFMRLIAQTPEASEAQKRTIAEANSPAGWRKAIAEVTAGAKRQGGRTIILLLIGAITFAMLAGILALFR
jgi:hypothetical protein